jgi:hypothetical protein
MILFYLNILYCNIYIYGCLKSVIIEFCVWIQTSFRFGGLFDWNFCNIKPYRWSNCHWETEGKKPISHFSRDQLACVFFLFVAKLDMRFESSVSQGKQGQVSGERPNKVWRLMKLISRCYLCISLGNKWVCSSLFSWFLILLIKGCERKIFFF